MKEMEEWAGPISEGGLGKFNLDRKGLFNKRTTLPKILSYKRFDKKATIELAP